MKLIINYRYVLRTIGLALMIESVFMLTGLPFSYYFHSGDQGSLLLAFAITLVAGFALFLPQAKAHSRNVAKREGYLVVSATWILMSAFGALPYMLSGAIPRFTDAFFESISGFSTTGASILTDVEAVPQGLLFWRSMTHWIGGMGIIVLSVAILPFLGAGGMQLFSAESSGPMGEKLHPRIRETARKLWGIYVLLTVAEIVMLLVGGMPLFEAMCHSFGTIATGGFGVKNDSIASYSPYIQYIITIFMILAATNFTLHFYALTGKPKRYWKDEEFRLFLGIITASALFIGLTLYFRNHYDLEHSLRAGFFQVASIISCTGFASEDFVLWPTALWLVLFFLMLIGGCAGSTTGSVKVMRYLMLFKMGGREFKKMFHPNAVLVLRYNKKPVSDDVMSKIMAFFLMYVLTFATGVLLLCINQIDFTSAAGAVATTMGGVGPGLGVFGPMSNFSAAPDFSKWVLSACMLLGRLELFAVLILFTISFWRR